MCVAALMTCKNAVTAQSRPLLCMRKKTKSVCGNSPASGLRESPEVQGLSQPSSCCRWRPEKGKMEQEDARATMGLQDALSLLPQEMLIKMVPTTRTILLRRTSKKMRTAVENAKVDVVVVRRRGVKFRNGEGLLDKLNGLNAWCRVTELRLNECELGEGGAQAIAAALRVKNTVTSLNLETNELGEGGGQAIAAALRVNH